MHIKRDISNWNINIILRVLIEGGNSELLSTICLLSATIQITSPTNRNFETSLITNGVSIVGKQ